MLTGIFDPVDNVVTNGRYDVVFNRNRYHDLTQITYVKVHRAFPRELASEMCYYARGLGDRLQLQLIKTTGKTQC